MMNENPKVAADIKARLSEPDVSLTAMLMALHPIQALIYVGPGYGLELAPFDKIENCRIVFLEADEDAYRAISRTHESRREWTFSNVLIHPAQTSVPFYIYNNGNENSVISHEILSGVWPGIRLVGSRVLEGRTLCSVIEEQSLDCRPNWIKIDCFSALDILSTADDFVRGLDVVLLRMPAERFGDDGLALDRLVIQSRMLRQGFMLIGTESERSAKAMIGFFVRDWKAAAFAYEARHETVQLESRNTIEELRSKINHEHAELVEARKEIEIARRRILAVESELEHRSNETESLMDTVGQAQRAKEEISESLEKTNVKLAAAIKEKNEIAAQHEECLSKSHDFEEKLSLLESERREAEDRLNNEICQLSAKVESGAQELEKIKLDLESATNKLVVKIARVEFLEPEIERLRSELNEKSEQNNRLAAAVTESVSMKAEIARLEEGKIKDLRETEQLRIELRTAKEEILTLEEVRTKSHQLAAQIDLLRELFAKADMRS